MEIPRFLHNVFIVSLFVSVHSEHICHTFQLSGSPAEWSCIACVFSSPCRQASSSREPRAFQLWWYPLDGVSSYSTEEDNIEDIFSWKSEILQLCKCQWNKTTIVELWGFQHGQKQLIPLTARSDWYVVLASGHLLKASRVTQTMECQSDNHPHRRSYIRLRVLFWGYMLYAGYKARYLWLCSHCHLFERFLS